MSKSIYSIIPDPEALVAIEPEELAGVVLEHFNSMDAHEQAQLNRHNFTLRYTVASYPAAYQDKILRALAEAWAWFEREGLIAEKPANESSGGWYYVTKRGQKITKAADLEAYRRADMLLK